MPGEPHPAGPGPEWQAGPAPRPSFCQAPKVPRLVLEPALGPRSGGRRLRCSVVQSAPSGAVDPFRPHGHAGQCQQQDCVPSPQTPPLWRWRSAAPWVVLQCPSPGVARWRRQLRERLEPRVGNPAWKSWPPPFFRRLTPSVSPRRHQRRARRNEVSRSGRRWPHTPRTPRFTPKDKDHREEHCGDCGPEGGQRRRGEGTQERVDGPACRPRPFFGPHRRPAVCHDPHARPQKPQKGRQHREPEDETDHIPGEGDPGGSRARPEPVVLLTAHSASALHLGGFSIDILDR